MKRKLMKKANGGIGDMAEVDSDDSLEGTNGVNAKVRYALNYKENTLPIIKELYNKSHL